MIESTCNGEKSKGNPRELIKFYEGRGYQAEREGNEYLKHVYWQSADHIKRYMRGER